MNQKEFAKACVSISNELLTIYQMAAKDLKKGSCQETFELIFPILFASNAFKEESDGGQTYIGYNEAISQINYFVEMNKDPNSLGYLYAQLCIDTVNRFLTEEQYNQYTIDLFRESEKELIQYLDSVYGK